jgi:mono/diheme cytochrome c family protein
MACAKLIGQPAELDGPRLEVADSIDLGEVKQGELAEYLVKFSNTGTEELRIEEVATSCGCTAVVLSSRVLAPGEEGELKITLDTFGKRGKIIKTISIFSNDYLEPEKIIQATAEVIPPPHPRFDMGETLFSPRCRSCHADKGKGLIGASLYLAICYQCHGVEGEGVSATALSDQDYLKAIDGEYLYRWIAQGKPGTAMPGYSRQYGGPLTKRQIDSLVEFILQWR